MFSRKALLCGVLLVPALAQAQVSPKPAPRPASKTVAASASVQSIYDGVDAVMKLLCSPDAQDPNTSPNRKRAIEAELTGYQVRLASQIAQLKVREEDLRLDVPHYVGAATMYASVAPTYNEQICRRQPVTLGLREVPVPIGQGVWAYSNGAKADATTVRECATKAMNGESAGFLKLSGGQGLAGALSAEGMMKEFYACVVPEKTISQSSALVPSQPTVASQPTEVVAQPSPGLFRPGVGKPTRIREVKPDYTEQAMQRHHALS